MPMMPAERVDRSLSVAINFGIVVLVVAMMELVANLTHKYVMHGWGWGWHKSHHVEHDDAIERNDLYAVVFALRLRVLPDKV